MNIISAIKKFGYVTCPELQDQFGKSAYVYMQDDDHVLSVDTFYFVKTVLPLELAAQNNWEAAKKHIKENIAPKLGIKFENIKELLKKSDITKLLLEDNKGYISVVIPKGVTEIGEYAFRDCKSLTSVTIPEGVTEIREGAFWCCTSLTSVTIPEGVTEIGDSAFEDCESLTSVAIPESVTEIGDSAFYNCTSLTSVVIPEGVTKIGYRAFACCKSLTSVMIPEGVTEIGDWAFRNCTSLIIAIPDNAIIGKNAVDNCRKVITLVTA